MTESTALWIAGVVVSLIMADVISYIMLKDKIADFNMALIQRVVRVEAVLDSIGIKSAKILHSPDDHLGIDSLLDKYLDRNCELTRDEWKMLLSRCEEIENDTSQAHGARLSAAMLNAICHHKLLMLPPKDRWWHASEPPTI